MAIHLADEWPVQAALWRSNATAGRLWVQISGALPGGLRLTLGGGYLAPAGSGGCPADIAAWWMELQAEWAEAEAAGAVLLAGDVNGRTSCDQDWPEEEPEWQPRRSHDRAPVNGHGRHLLQLCCSSTARICNGRVLGSTSGDATSFGVSGSGKAVVDYFLASASLLPLLPEMAVDGDHPAAQLSDHATLLLALPAPQPAGQQGQAQRGQPGQAQFQPATEEQLEAAVAQLGDAAGQLAALANKADAAVDSAQLAEVAEGFAAVVVGALEGAGVRRKSGGSGGRRHQQGLPWQLQQKYGIAAANRAHRQARQQAAGGASLAEVGRCRNRVKRLVSAAWHECHQRRGTALERQARADPRSFFMAYRSRSARVLGSMAPTAVVQHFEGLLGGGAPEEERPPPEPPPEPPPPAAAALATAAAAAGSQQSASQLDSQPDPAALLARMHSRFTTAEVAAAALRTKQHKAVAGSLPPWFLKAAASQLAAALAAQFNAWQRLGRLPPSDALSIITPIPKAGGDPRSCSSLRGIAVGTMAAKLYATILEQRLSDWAEASGSRAEGQFGFRRKRSTAQAAFVLRALQDQHRSSGQQMFACFVDFQQAYDTVPRAQLWEKLHAAGLGGEWLRAVQALYADVPMAVRTADGVSAPFQARIGLKQGCPASPTLFGLYIDDFEAAVLAADAAAAARQQPSSGAAAAAAQLQSSNPAAAGQQGQRPDLPVLLGSSSPVPPVLYADDMVLLATSAAGLQRQLDVLQQYCQRWGLTVNLVKTKLMLLSGARTQQSAQQTAEAAGLRFAGQPLAVVVSFKYLGIVFHSSTCLAGCAAAARALLAHKAMHDCRARCAELGIEAAPVQLQLFSTMVDSVLSHGAEVWGMQLAAQAAASPASTARSKAEQVHIQYLRQLLGVRQSTPSAVVLVEAGEQPLWLRWLRRAAKLWNSMLEAPQDSLLHQALAASRQLAEVAPAAAAARQPWAAQFAAAMAAVGQPVNLREPEAVSLSELVESGQERQLAQLTAAATREGASKLQHYVRQVWGPGLVPPALGRRQPYLEAVRRRQQREALAQLRTGSHWGAEETGRWERQPREARTCPHCQLGVEDATHMIFDCPLYTPQRRRWGDLFAEPRSLALFFVQDPTRLAGFVAACRRQWEQATAAFAAIP